jgi:hypothetical protein
MLRALPRWAWSFQQHLSLVFEIGAPVLFVIPRLRGLAMCLGIAFHLMIALTMNNLIFFSAQMWTFYALFITVEKYQRLGGWRRLKNEPSAWSGGTPIAFFNNRPAFKSGPPLR